MKSLNGGSRADRKRNVRVRVRVAIALCSAFTLALACGGSDEGDADGGLSDEGSGATGSGASSSKGSGTGGNTGSGGSLVVTGGTSTGGAGDDPSDAGFDACTGSANEQEELPGPLDIYFVFDRTASMGQDCAYDPGDTPPVDSKACYATYALSDYLTTVEPITETRLAFQFVSLPGDSCDGTAYSTPLVALRELPVPDDDELVTTISNENFEGGYGTEIEGALNGIATYTSGNVTEGREMIGVLMTDGDPTDCETDNDLLAQIISDHLEETGIRTFIIGMDGANEDRLEQLAIAGGAEPHDDWCGSVAAPCHSFNVGDGSGDAIASALQAIVQQATPLPCEYPVSGFLPPEGETVDYDKVNVELTDPDGKATTIGWVENEGACPPDQPAWYYDDRDDPTKIVLCEDTCTLVTAQETGSRVTVVVGCEDTMIVMPPK